jgi:hypothetical protein
MRLVGGPSRPPLLLETEARRETEDASAASKQEKQVRQQNVQPWFDFDMVGSLACMDMKQEE